MKRTKLYLTVSLLVFAMLPLLTACSSDADTIAVRPGKSEVGITLKIPARATGADANSGSTMNGGYEFGSEAESYIDFTNADNYRILFFDNDNKFLATLNPAGIIPTSPRAPKPGESDNYVQDKEYLVIGQVPTNLLTLGNFKIVVLANWESYPAAGELTVGSTTIESICTGKHAQFRAFSEADADLDATGKRIPFFGVQEYKDKTFKKGMRTTLDEEVMLLRAVAKIEVIVNTDATTTKAVRDGDFIKYANLTRHNAYGFAAPGGVTTRGDYVHNAWDKDFTRTTNLVGGSNDDIATPLNLKKVQAYKAAANGEKAVPEKWVAYVPEFRNIGAGDDFASVKLRFKFQDENEKADGTLIDDKVFELFFAEYVNGRTDNADDASKRFDILRNNIYRFTLSIADGTLKVVPQKWTNAFDNNFSFD